MADAGEMTAGAEPLAVAVERVQGEVLVRLAGELDLATAPRLAGVLDQVVAGLPQRIAVDCAQLDFVDAAGLSVLLAARRSLEPAGGVLVLRSPSPLVVRLLGLLDLRRALPVEP